MDENRKKALAAALSQIEKQFGKGSVMRMGDAGAVRNVEVISTGSLGLDLALGVGGVPKGRVVELFGPESAGKTMLALQIVADGEGATKPVTIKVSRAVNEKEAEEAARTIANSPLVKTAFFGEDANWGRIIGAAGRAGPIIDPDKIDVYFNTVQMVKGGLGRGRTRAGCAAINW